MKKVFISVGDVSAANYVYEVFKEGFEEYSLAGITDERLEKIGIRSVARLEELSLVGLVEVLPKLLKLKRIYDRVLKELKGSDVLIACDAPGFNLRLIKKAKSLGVKRVIYFISPQVWAWKPSRARLIARYADDLILILPFEVDFYKSLGYSPLRVHYLGHPLVDMVKPSLSRGEFLGRVGLEDRFIALLPGSRWGELKRHLPLLRRVVAEMGDYRFVVPTFGSFSEYIKDSLPFGNVRVISERELSSPSYNAMAYADFALIASGTASLEAGIMGCPHLVFYRTNPITFRIAKRLVKVDYVSLVNLLLGEGVIPELLQTRPETISELSRRLIDNPVYLENVRRRLESLRVKLGEGGVITRLRDLFLKLI